MRICRAAASPGAGPLQNSSGGRERLGRISKMGDRYLRRLMVIGGAAASPAVPEQARQGDATFCVAAGTKAGAGRDRRHGQQMARIVWALMTRGETYRAAHTPMLVA